MIKEWNKKRKEIESPHFGFASQFWTNIDISHACGTFSPFPFYSLFSNIYFVQTIFHGSRHSRSLFFHRPLLHQFFISKFFSFFFGVSFDVCMCEGILLSPFFLSFLPYIQTANGEIGLMVRAEVRIYGGVKIMSDLYHPCLKSSNFSPSSSSLFFCSRILSKLRRPKFQNGPHFSK